MHDIVPLLPRRPVPPLSVPLVGGGRFDLASEKPELFTFIDFYRGFHCPQCRNHLKELESKLPEFQTRGVSVVAVSVDDAERAARTKQEWELPFLRIGYGLDLKTARAWGLYLTSGRGKTSIGVDETSIFNEPGLFLVRPDGTLHAGFVQTVPFARPPLAALLAAIDFIKDRNYPPRGDVATLPPAAA
jgi:peroxiredoxin